MAVLASTLLLTTTTVPQLLLLITMLTQSNALAFVQAHQSPWVESQLIHSMRFRTNFFPKLGPNDLVADQLKELLEELPSLYADDHPANYPIVAMILKTLAAHLDGVSLNTNNKLVLAFFPSLASGSANNTAVQRLHRFQLTTRLMDVLMYSLFPHMRLAPASLAPGGLLDTTTAQCPTTPADVYPRAKWVISKVANMNISIDSLMGQMVG